MRSRAPRPAPDPDDQRDLRWRRAHLVTSRLLTWPAAGAPGLTFHLHVARDGGMRVIDDRVVGTDLTLALRLLPSGLPNRLTERDGYRHLAGRAVLHLAADDEVADAWLGGQLAVTATGRDGGLVAATGVQTALAIDERFATEAPLGVRWDPQGHPTCAVWAPTARRVWLHRTDEPPTEPWVAPAALDAQPAADQPPVLPALPTSHPHQPPTDRQPHQPPTEHRPHQPPTDRRLHQPVPMERTPGGVWEVTGEPHWRGTAYRYEVEVYDPDADRVVRNLVTDPWSVGLSADSRWSLLLDVDDLDDRALAPRGWSSGTAKPRFTDQARMVAYELHVRDFSAADDSVPEELRGTYRAFCLAGSHGVRHLRALAEAGVSHLHLLPINDIASVPERRADRRTPIVEVTGGRTPPDSPLAQAAQQAVADHDGYNWGYDPYHWLVPEGSYATDPDGPTRIREVREMVAAINRLGLRVVVDVVFNHTHRSGRHPMSVLDRIVPGYFHRLDDLGRVTTSTCCPNTATEHAMMERLITDAVVTWARVYRVDGFRFDLLGHHPAGQAQRLRAALDRLTPERDGVDGPSIVLYGEGWNFGEVADDARFLQATQTGLAGSGIGTFDDRLRDAVRGGNHVGARHEQGFASGLWWEPNAKTEVEGDGLAVERARAAALDLTERVMLGVTGNLAELAVPCTDGVVRPGREITYGGSAAGYAQRPQDQIAYVSAHDNETLFDALAAKLPVATTMDDRVRMQVVALATVLLGQGTPFLHAGCELLRSKSLDRDSYRSGDLFNAIDWSAQTTRWGVGIPPVASNPDQRQLLAELLRTIDAPSPAHIATCRDRVLELLRIRASSPLFGLPTSDAVRAALRFRLTGSEAVPGVVVWSLQGSADVADHDLLLAINATPQQLQATLGEDPHPVAPSRTRGSWRLHPVLSRSVDARSHEAHVEGDRLIVPERTVAVFLRGATG